MKSVLISIQPKWCELIASGKKTIEVRKSRPRLETPFKVYIYCTQGKFKDLGAIGDEMYRKRMKVIGEFVCSNIGTSSWIKTPDHPLWKDGYDEECCLTNKELYEYSKGNVFYEWCISDLVIYDKPKELSEFCSYNCSVYVEGGYPMPTHEIKRPPQSWYYVERLIEKGGAE